MFVPIASNSFRITLLSIIYILFLFSPLHSLKLVTPGLIIGGGRIGPLSGPIYVCTRNNDLKSIIEKTPDHRKCDLVFLQNGILTEFLKSHELQDNTQALIYYAVSKKGEQPIDGKTDLNPDGLTAVTGKWASDFEARMTNAGLACNVFEKPRWEVAMYEKHIWICAFMAVGAKYKCSVGEVEKNYNNEVRSLIKEMAQAISETKNVLFENGVEDRLCAYARSVAHFPTALKELEWRNGWFINLTLKALKESKPDPCPMHTEIISNHPDGSTFLLKAKESFLTTP